MSFRKRLLVLFLVALLLAALNALLAPFVVAHGIRFWLQWAAKQEGLSVEIGKIEAPFLKPVTIQKLRLFSPPGTARDISLQAEKVVADLNFHGRIFSQRAAFLHSVEIDRLAGTIQTAIGKGRARNLEWRILSRVVPQNFRIEHANLDLVAADLALGFQEVTLSGSAIESGKFFARRVTLRSPILRQTFLDLRGATSWEGKRLTIAGIPLVRGLDLETLTLDLSHLARRRLGLELQLDAYGGVLRTSFQGRAGEKFVVDLAGSASNVSLAQVARAFGLLEPISGTLRAAKFTFRGNPGAFLDATASVWMELTNFAWRDRRADNLMFGANYYGRRLEIEQLYVRQRENQLTINGELLWPKDGRSWMQLPFRGQLNATIPDLNRFAKLFGATTGDFRGALIAEGQLDALAAEPKGRLNLRGKGVSFREVTLESLGASLQLRGTELTLEKLEARHSQDFLRAEGEIDLHSPHRFGGRLTGAISDLAAYAPLLPAIWQKSKIGGGATFDWRGDGTLAANSGTMQFYAHQLQFPIAPLRMPLDVTLEGSYSPQDMFFRTLQIGNDRLWLGGFLMLGGNFIELQAMQLTLDGAARATGTIFLPISANRWRLSHDLLAALDAKQKFDVDLMVHDLDLGSLAQALGESFPLNGTVNGKLAAFGSLGELQVTAGGRLQNFGGSSADDSLNFEVRYADGWLGSWATALFGRSNPVKLSVSVPLRLEKERLIVRSVVNQSAPISFTLSYPALFLEDLPNELRPWSARGLVSGDLTVSNTWAAPRISGEGGILAANLKPPAPWPEIEEIGAHFAFKDEAAVITRCRGLVGGKNLLLTGRLTMSLPDFRLTLEPSDPELALADVPPSGTALSSVRLVGQGVESEAPRLEQAVVSGKIGSSAASLTIYSKSGGAVPLRQQATFFLRPHAIRGEPLLLRALPSPTISLGPNEPQTRSR